MEAMFGMITWRPGVGDPTVVGWVTTVGYGVAAALCARAGRQAGANDECLMTNDEGADEEHRASNIEHPTSNAEMKNAEVPRKGAKGTKNFQTANDANQSTMNEIPAGAPEFTAGAAVVPGAERKSRSEGAGDFQVFKFSGPQTQDARMCFGLGMALLFLGINKQLDLQTLLIQIGRDLAVSEGWFERRRHIQTVLAIAGIVGGGLGLTAVGWKQRRFFQKNPLTILGIALLALYFSLRIVAIDHVGEPSGVVVPDEAWWLSAVELAGVASLALAAERRAMTNDE